MIILRKPGAVSFEDILTVNGLTCNTYKQECQECGLLEGDQQWHVALSEASQFQSPRQMRMLFAMFCGFGEVENVLDMWEQQKVSLAEVFVHNYSEEIGTQYALADIEKLLASYNLSLQKLNLPQVNLINYVVWRNANYDVREEQTKANIYTAQLNIKQKNAVEIVLNAVNNNSVNTPNCFFLKWPCRDEKNVCIFKFASHNMG